MSLDSDRSLLIKTGFKFYLTIINFFTAIFVSAVHADSVQVSQLSTVTVIGEQAVEGAEIGGTPAKELPINIHVINTEELERLRFVDSDELLDRIPGETQVRNLRIPDGGKGYTIPMVDGIPLESPYEGATQRIDRVNTSDIQRVEVIKGPASAIYPNNAFGGIINVITREPPLESESEIWVEAGEFKRQRLGINTGGTLDKLGYFVDINTRNLDGLRDGVRDDRDQFSSKFVYSASEKTRITTRIEHLQEFVVSRGDLTADEIDADPTQRGGDNSSEDLEQDTISFKVEHLLDTGDIDFSLVYRDKDTIGLSRFRGPQDESDVGISSKLLYRHDLDFSNVILGFETYDGEQDTDQFARGDSTLSGPAAKIDGVRDIRAYFVQYELEATDRLGFSLGARYEDISISSQSSDTDDASGSASFNDTSPKFGVTYDLSRNNMLWLGISKGFYAPEISDIVGDPGEPETANNNLEPEESTNIEVGLRGTAGNWSYDTSYYHNTIKNYLVDQEFQNAMGDDIERTTNAGKVTVEGLESVVEYTPPDDNWRIGLTHTYARNIYDSFVSSDGDFSGNELSRSPRHHFNARLAWLPMDKLIFELEGDFYSSYFSDDANTPEGKFKRDERINLRVSYDNGPWRFWLHGLNLTDTLEDRATFRRGTLRFRTVDGRAFYAGVAYRF